MNRMMTSGPFMIALLLQACLPFRPDPGDRLDPRCRVTIRTDSGESESSEHPWPVNKPYYRFSPGSPVFIAGCNDKSGLSTFNVRVCAESTVQKPLHTDLPLKNEFGSNKRGAALVGGTLRSLKKGEIISVIGKCKDSSGKTCTASLYAFAGAGQEKMMPANGKHPDLCAGPPAYFDFDLKGKPPLPGRACDERKTVSYCGCVNPGTLSGGSCGAGCVDNKAPVSAFSIRPKELRSRTGRDIARLTTPAGSQSSLGSFASINYRDRVQGYWRAELKECTAQAVGETVTLRLIWP